MSAAFGKQFAQQRTVAAAFVLAITTYREISLVGQGSEDVEFAASIGLRHFPAVFAAECGPFLVCFGVQRLGHKIGRRREVGNQTS